MCRWAQWGDYPGKVKSVAENKVTVSVIHRSGGFFKCANHKDEINYRMESGISKADPPTVVGNQE